MNTTVLQVPINKALRDKATKAAANMGFSSLQESVRVFLNQLAAEDVHISFTSKTVQLSSKNDKRYAKMLEQVKTKKVKTESFSDISALMDYLEK